MCGAEGAERIRLGDGATERLGERAGRISAGCVVRSALIAQSLRLSRHSFSDGGRSDERNEGDVAISGPRSLHSNVGSHLR